MIIPRYRSEISLSSFLNPLGIRKYYKLKDENSFYFSSATSAIYEYLKTLNLSSDAVVAVPLYSCSSVWQAIYDSGYKIKFLDVGLDVDKYIFDANALEGVNILIFIHYFGFSYDLREIKILYPDIVIISDNTHKNIHFKHDDVYDVSIYSFNFHKPITAGQGGLLKLNTNSLFFNEAKSNLKKINCELDKHTFQKDISIYSKIIIKNSMYNKWIYSFLYSSLQKRENKFKPPILSAVTSSMELGLLGKIILGNQLSIECSNKELINNYRKLPEKFRLNISEKDYICYFPLFLSNKYDKSTVMSQLLELKCDAYMLWQNYAKNAEYYGYKDNGAFINTQASLDRMIFLPEQLLLDKNIRILNKLITRIQK